MKTEIENGRKIMVFDSTEELKWYYHRKLCKGVNVQYFMEHCNTVKEANEHALYNLRVKTLVEWYEDLESLPDDFLERSDALSKYPQWVRELENPDSALKEKGTLPEWWICEEELET